MNKNTILYIAILAIVGVVIGIFLFSGKGSKKNTSKKTGSDDSTYSSTKGYSDTTYPDAPFPYSESAELEDEANNLWPTAIKSVKNEAHKEKIREQWRDFSARYPKNIYTLNEFKPAMTEKDIAERKATLDSFAGVDAFFARSISASKYAAVGFEPKTPKEAGITPAEQRSFFDFKTRELESRIELIEYTKENKGFSSEQMQVVDKDVESWKKEIEQLKAVAKTVPNS